MIQNYRNQYKNKRSKLDFVYEILYNCQEPRTPKSVFVLTGIFQKTFYELFDECVDKNLIEKVEIKKGIPTTEKRRNYVYYQITSKGNNFIIWYNKMVVYIEKMNLIFK
jgi:predicted transcriptional regulator